MQHDINGLLVIDKPEGITSAKAVAKVKRLCGVKKVGHAGTLDPFATGVLICCINKATKLATFLLRGTKKYSAVLHLGISTDTQDATGTILSTSERLRFSEEAMKEAFERFKGYIQQTPPVYSALKHKGVPLHKLARSGKAVTKPPRQVHIADIHMTKMKMPFVYFEVSCSAGTYVRTLCADIGRHLGCGGHLKTLRRTQSSGFTIKDALTLSDLEGLAEKGDMPAGLADRVIGMADALPDLPEICVNEGLKEKIFHGTPLTARDLSRDKAIMNKGFVKIVDANRTLLAILNDDMKSDKLKYSCVLS